MMKPYDFTRLINKYSVTFELVSESEGTYVDGHWKKGESVIKECTGAIIPMSERKIYQSGGNYTTKDRQLYVTEKFSEALKDSYVKYKNDKYKIEEETDFDDYADVYVYMLKWVSKFD